MLALIAESEAAGRQGHSDCLRSADWDVVESDEGRDALAKALSMRLDLLVIDARLTGISGPDLCQVLRNDVETRTIPIVLVTAPGEPIDPAGACHSAADAVLPAPCGDAALMAAVEKLMQRPKGLRLRRAAPAGAACSRRPGRVRLPAASETPAAAPPELMCPECDQWLRHQRTHIGGASAKQSEQWDYYECSRGCGKYQYRPRTRRLRRL
jgi:DNA-binding response OmpR family regulator